MGKTSEIKGGRLETINRRIARLHGSLSNETPIRYYEKVAYTGVDLGTADVVLVVLDRDREPLVGRLSWTSVVREGLIFDFVNTVQIVREMKQEVESLLGRKLSMAAGGLPPGTVGRDTEAVRYALEDAGFEVTNVVDEPSAAALALGITDGAVVDIGGGTTGISVLQDGDVLYSADEPTGGRHMTLVLAGRYGLSLEEAEKLKIQQGSSSKVRDVLRPVMEKMAAITRRHVAGYGVRTIYLVGGTSCVPGIEEVVQEEVGIQVMKPHNPLLVTPIGIAMACGGGNGAKPLDQALAQSIRVFSETIESVKDSLLIRLFNLLIGLGIGSILCNIGL